MTKTRIKKRSDTRIKYKADTRFNYGDEIAKLARRIHREELENRLTHKQPISRPIERQMNVLDVVCEFLRKLNR